MRPGVLSAAVGPLESDHVAGNYLGDPQVWCSCLLCSRNARQSANIGSQYFQSLRDNVLVSWQNRVLIVGVRSIKTPVIRSLTSCKEISYIAQQARAWPASSFANERGCTSAILERPAPFLYVDAMAVASTLEHASVTYRAGLKMSLHSLKRVECFKARATCCGMGTERG